MSDSEGLRLGGILDGEPPVRSSDDLSISPHSLTTHGVIVGMTGSGKTGLGIVLLEEILASGRPAILVDPKGDLANLCLQFPRLEPEDFRPWVDEGEARRDGISPETLAEKTASLWRKGLGGWGLGGEDISALKESVQVRVFTPGASAGVGLDLVGRMTAPESRDPEALAEAAESLVSGLLTLAGIDADPLTSPEHILLTAVIQDGWSRGGDLSLETLIAGVQDPPFRKLGVFEVDTFVPQEKRTKLALRLNGLLASPSFAAWRRGEPLDVASLLYAPDGRPRASVIQLAHLSEEERVFVMTLLLSRLITWMRAQPGTSDLRALLYIDELFGFAPPTAEPPSKKPLLTLFKQARAHGLGVVVSTQNPVDMDYKLMSNAGTWMVGRLQTERDKKRIIEALKSADGAVDAKAWDARIGNLGKRQFVLKRSRSANPDLFTTRWAMSYLRGPVTLAELPLLPPEYTAAAAAAETEGPGERAGAGGEARDGEEVEEGKRIAESTGDRPTSVGGSGRPDESPVQPTIADGVRVRFLDPAADWAGSIGVAPGSGRLQAGLGFRVLMLFDETAADLRHVEEWEAVLFPLDGTPDPADALPVDLDERDFRETAPPDPRFVLGEADLGRKSFFRELEKALVDHLYVEKTLRLPANRALKLVGRPGESPEAFRDRCVRAAEDRADEEASKLRDRYEAKLRTQRDQAVRAERRVRELESDVSSRREQELLTGAGEILGMFLGGRRRTRSLAGLSRRRSGTRRVEERLKSAEGRLSDELEDVRELEEELAEELEEIWDRWRAAAEDIDTMEVGLEKGDIRVSDVTLFWAPVPSDPA